jgi:hypothetical protein
VAAFGAVGALVVIGAVVAFHALTGNHGPMPRERLHVPATLAGELRRQEAVGAADSAAAGDDATGFAKGRLSPARGQARARELHELEDIQRRRTAGGLRITRWLDANGTSVLWSRYLRAHRRELGSTAYASTSRELGLALSNADRMSGALKDAFNETRPYDADHGIHSAVGWTWSSAFPSGHASAAFAADTVLSHALPKDAAEIHRLAAEVAYSRMYAGVHTASDVEAGAYVGGLAGQAALDDVRVY